MIKLSDYIFEFLYEKGIEHAFILPGGGAMHLIDSVGKSEIETICNSHEQAAAIGAESYGQHTNDIGLAVVTSGPGSTNAITGVAAGWIDSTPMMIISGQAKTTDLMRNTGVRQMGSQEVDIVNMVSGITKYSKQVINPQTIRYHLEKAYTLATTGRKGPVWLDIPLDVQGAMIDCTELEGYVKKDEEIISETTEKSIQKIKELILNSKAPLFLAGNGIKLAECEEEFLTLARKLEIPIITTWKMIDLMGEDDPLYAGHPGIMGDRGANFILQSADLLISIGSRVDASITAFNQKNFAKNAKKVIVDIDKNEINKLDIEMEVSVELNAKLFVDKLAEVMKQVEYKSDSKWRTYCREIRVKYPVVLEKHWKKENIISAYCFIDKLCEQLEETDVIVPESSGGAGEITYQAFKVKKGQKIKNAAGLGSMGFGLPYSIGACIANGKRRTILINGDGAFQLNIQELETVVRLNLPIKMFIWNNGGYASIRNMQKNLFEGNFVASSEESGFTVPKISSIAKAYGLKTFEANKNTEIEEMVKKVLETKGPVLCELYMDENETVEPKAKSIRLADGKMKSKPLEDMWPFLEKLEVEEAQYNVT